MYSSTSAYNFGSSLFNSGYQLKEEDVNLKSETFNQKGTSYATGKRECEKYLVEEATVSFTIFRPPKIFGPNDPSGRIWWWIQRAIDGQGFIIPDHYIDKFQFVFIDDLVKCILKSINTNSSRNRIYNVAMDEICGMKDWIYLLSQVTGNPIKFCFIPMNVIKNDSKLKNYKVPLYNYSPYLFNTSKIKEDLNIQFTPAIEWLSNTVEWFKTKYKGSDSEGYEYRNQEMALYKDWI